MAKNISKINFTLDDVLKDIVVSNFEFSSGSENRNLSSSEENIDKGFDPIVDHEDTEPERYFYKLRLSLELKLYLSNKFCSSKKVMD